MWSYISCPLTGGEAEQFLSACDVVTAQNMFSEITQDREVHKDHRGEEKKNHFTCQCCQGQNQEPAAQRHLFTIGAAQEWDTKQRRDVYAACVGPSVCRWRDLVCGCLLVRAGVSSLSQSISPLLLLPYHSLSPLRAELGGAQRINIQWASVH